MAKIIIFAKFISNNQNSFNCLEPSKNHFFLPNLAFFFEFEI